MEEDEAEDFVFVAVVVGGGAGDDDALGVDHFAHDAAGAIGSGHEDGADAGFLGGDFLKAPEEDIGGGFEKETVNSSLFFACHYG